MNERIDVTIKVHRDLVSDIHSGLQSRDSKVLSERPDGTNADYFLFSAVTSNLKLLIQYLNVFKPRFVKLIEGVELELALLDFSQCNLRAITWREFKEACVEVLDGDVNLFNLIVFALKYKETDSTFIPLKVVKKMVAIQKPEELKEDLDVKRFGIERFLELKKVLYHILKPQTQI